MNFTLKFCRLNLKFAILGTLFLFTFLTSQAQGLKKMTPEVYSIWNKIKNVTLSDSGQVVFYTIEKEIGDKKAAVYLSKQDQTLYIDKVTKVALDPSGKHLIFKHHLGYDSMRTLKRKKTPKDKLPLDSLTILNLDSQSKIVFSDVDDFTTASDYGGFVFITKKIKCQKDTLSTPISNDVKDSLNVKKDLPKKDLCDSKALIIYNLNTNFSDTILNIKEFSIAKNEPYLAYSQCFSDSSLYHQVYWMDLNSLSNKRISDAYYHLEGVSINDQGQNIAFLGLKNKTLVNQKSYQIFLYTPKDTIATHVCDSILCNIPENWVISHHKTPSWSSSGSRVFFGIAPILPEKDTMLLEDEMINVEIWHHDAPKLYTELEASKEADIKKTFAVLYDINEKVVLPLETQDLDKTLISAKGDGRYALQLRNHPYQKRVTWQGEHPKDFVLLDTKTKETLLVAVEENGNPEFSPSGRYIYWWNRQDSIWKTFDTEKKMLSVLGLWSISTFHNELNDVPQKANPYGIAGWLSGDSIAVVYDRYDLWQLKPSNPIYNKQLTFGRDKKEVHRYIKLSSDEMYLPDSNLLLHVFDENTKSDSYKIYDKNADTTLLLLKENVKYQQYLVKAKSSSKILFTKESFEIFPDLWMSDTTFLISKRISDVNPQQKDYAWGKAQLISWTNYRGKKNEGLLYYPADYNPELKYPMIVNFYEKSSNELYRHKAPEAHRSSINYSYYTNNGYFIFNPDISYTTGQPGEDCVNAVESGVDFLVKQGWIDEKNIALQGHSWGGYQIAYLLTKSERYKCAEAGAPVVNMVSAYGGVRWESGMSRMFQYEKAQSRLGASLWENPELYHKNSPIYEMPKVNAPVLIMHNDEDGAVPWYQGIEYYMALRRLGKPAWLLNYNNEPHWPVKWQNRLDFNIRMEQFFDHFLKDKPMPLWMKEGNTPLTKGILNKY